MSLFCYPASATITSEVADIQHFRRFWVLNPDTYRTAYSSNIGCIGEQCKKNVRY